ncbi:DUF4291 domain-containing protein [Mucilaginibacter rubeus]|uniref:DUF4291 domain-containing protein n=1 Tax=Mucilaginibacter rubeus TaxID=2027860 RepID=A0AAE6JIM0_9SPHI|nr:MULTISPECIES: DUF4291 domain-containing protein [Mucilaginibacter]QEM06404.1 DUF4291 domain-containing protein [Mucilaginibacter rubeus]QEM18988.1 DUF4291 domain-containing protein [Mucilaginibacter gossypii]QTE44470.1 DUF4291 domain-containing protein [Mucilaginibacter rubeus]QTE51068.1 DUF4291 domain-containing protein [Mucilaginibacter rubeus]QTE56154.1 DUF4291 domain-containing protein [Mucilaginibacter rubeus]
MNIITEFYQQALEHWPKTGQHILAHQINEEIVVYQAYKKSIARFAAENQFLGGNEYSYNRMSWIKPNFLWMTYRCGWAEKENQESVLALWISKKDFESILNEAVISSFNPSYHDNHEQWRADLDQREVRLQWDPDHDPYGHKQERRAIQLGLKGGLLENFGKKQIIRIEDITGFVKQQKSLLDSGRLDELRVPVERVYRTIDNALNKRVGITP